MISHFLLCGPIGPQVKSAIHGFRLDNTMKDNVQAHRTTGEDRFFNQYQNLGAAWSFGVIGAFEIWGYY
jgi:hypothetical protein